MKFFKWEGSYSFVFKNYIDYWCMFCFFSAIMVGVGIFTLGGEF